MQNECKVSFITINYNGLKDTRALLDCIPREPDVEVIVVDNASAGDDAAVIASDYPWVRVVRSDRNLGFAGGNNLGIQAAKGRYLFFINNDTELKDDFSLGRLVERFETSEKIGMVCPKIRFAQDDCPIQYAGYTPLSAITMRNRSIGFGEPDHGQYNTPHKTPYAHGAAMLVSREAIEKAGMMPECFFLYYEELDWSMMMIRAGFDIWYEPACTIYHKESQSTGKASPLRTYYVTRNRLLFAHRNIGFPVRILTYCYLIGIVTLRDLVVHIIRKRLDLAKAVLKAVKDFAGFLC